MKRKENRKGFTLIELIIALGVFSAGIMAAFTLALAGLNTSKDNYARIQAANLAREGIELVRNKRDINWLKIDNNTDCSEADGLQFCEWNEDLDPGDYIIDINGSWEGDGNIALKYDEGEHVYIHADEGEAIVDTNMSREVNIKNICLKNNDNSEEVLEVSCDVGDKLIGLEVSVTLFWELLGKDHQIVVKEKLYNWKRW